MEESGRGICSFSYNETGGVHDKYELHCHDYYEVYYFLEGDVDYVVEGRNYRPAPDSILLFGPHMMHGVRINSLERPYRRYTLHFSEDILSPGRQSFLLEPFPSLMQEQKKQVYFENVKRFHIATYFESLLEFGDADEVRKDPEGKERLSLCVEALISRVVALCEANQEEWQGTGPDLPSRIICYLNRNLREDINLEQLCEKFYISKHHLNKIFRKATGTTVYDYLLRKRISIARRLLLDGMGIQEAAAEVGFKDYSVFYRSYKRIVGHAPSQDKKVACNKC